MTTGIGLATRGRLCESFTPQALGMATIGRLSIVGLVPQDIIYDVVYIDRTDYPDGDIDRDDYGDVYIDQGQYDDSHIDRTDYKDGDITTETYEEVEA